MLWPGLPLLPAPLPPPPSLPLSCPHPSMRTVPLARKGCAPLEDEGALSPSSPGTWGCWYVAGGAETATLSFTAAAAKPELPQTCAPKRPMLSPRTGPWRPHGCRFTPVTRGTLTGTKPQSPGPLLPLTPAAPSSQPTPGGGGHAAGAFSPAARRPPPVDDTTGHVSVCPALCRAPARGLEPVSPATSPGTRALLSRLSAKARG